MSKRLVLSAAIAMLICMVIGSASADRLIITPKGTTLSTGGISAEYADNSDGDGTIYWVNVGISRFEIEGARFVDFGPDEADVFGLQASVIPETSFTPALAVGCRNIADENGGLLASYNERSFYVSASKAIPVTEGVPGLLGNAAVHGGVGTGGLSGFFFGVDATIVPLGVAAAVEYDTEDWNWAVSYGFAGVINAKITSIKGDLFYGFTFSTGI